MKVGFAIGNGTSREGFDLEQLRGHGITVGCNGIYTEFTPDIVIALDRVPRTAILELEERPFKFMTVKKDRKHLWLDDEPVMTVAQVNGGIGKLSGLVACSYLAKTEKCHRVYMFGFDFFRVHPGMTKNDMYHDKILRNKNVHRSFMVLSKACQQTEFVRVGDIHASDETFYQMLSPYYWLMDYPEFKERLARKEL